MSDCVKYFACNDDTVYMFYVTVLHDSPEKLDLVGDRYLFAFDGRVVHDRDGVREGVTVISDGHGNVGGPADIVQAALNMIENSTGRDGRRFLSDIVLL